MKNFLNWLDHRTGIRNIIHESLYERIPGGARWRYVWGSTLVFTFFIQVVTGIFLWMSYSPSKTTAWESVYYIQHQMEGGWFLRGLHHYTAQAMVVLLAFHLLQVVIHGAYKAPREMNFWLGLILLQIVLGLALTGYLLPWDQKGYWATRVATKLAGITPGVGDEVQTLAVGGSDYGQLTLTRFFALHAGLLPGLLIAFLVMHIAIFRRHGIHAPDPKGKPDAMFWPDQVLKDAIACLAVLAMIIFCIFWPAISGKVEVAETGKLGAELMAPADASASYDAARPEWYFLSLFQLLKLTGGLGKLGPLIGAFGIPGLLMLILFAMPIVGRWKLGHRFNVAFLFAVLFGAAFLTYLAMREDNYARNYDAKRVAELHREAKIRQYNPSALGGDPKDAKLLANEKEYNKLHKSQLFLEAVEGAEHEAARAAELAGGEGRIPLTGALTMLQNDPQTQGAKLFARNCAGCHDYAPPGMKTEIDPTAPHTKETAKTPRGENMQISNAPVQHKHNSVVRERLQTPVTEKGEDGTTLVVKREKDGTVLFRPSGAPNLYGFASRPWLGGFLDKNQISQKRVDQLITSKSNDPKMHYNEIFDANYFGNTAHADGTMAGYVKDDMDFTAEQKNQIIAALSAEAKLPSQEKAERDDEKTIAAGRKLILDSTHCAQCHQPGGGENTPDLKGYGSPEWLKAFVKNPEAKRFYGKGGIDSDGKHTGNDRMPGFGGKLTEPEIDLIVRFLRGEE